MTVYAEMIREDVQPQMTVVVAEQVRPGRKPKATAAFAPPIQASTLSDEELYAAVAKDKKKFEKAKLKLTPRK